ncbi:MAG: hypothetical protein IJ549_02925 [Prevotella sp.]|nr:hypothetical protein [Prevotella sp.]
MNVLTRNYFRMLRQGAFGEKQPMEPMSQYKWQQLRLRARSEHTEQYLPDSDVPQKGLSGLSNYKKSRRHRSIEKAEYHSIDTSLHSLDFLHLMAFNVHSTMIGETRIDGIIEMGRFLRTKGDKVDFLKVEQWLHKMGIYKLSQLHAAILIELFGFSLDELPFIQHSTRDAIRLAAEDRKLTTAFLTRYPGATLHSMLTRLHTSITEIEE